MKYVTFSIMVEEKTMGITSSNINYHFIEMVFFFGKTNLYRIYILLLT